MITELQPHEIAGEISDSVPNFDQQERIAALLSYIYGASITELMMLTRCIAMQVKTGIRQAIDTVDEI